ncbi:MAG: MoxR family ATPase [Rubrivivax sp.]|nr:MoxR family ATPase [Rubrivivax sp.]
MNQSAEPTPLGFGSFKGEGAIAGHVHRGDPLKDPAGYRASPPLVQAVNVALALKRPLLLTGDPGTGKTQLAYRMAAELALGEVLRFNTKSGSVATDLFYQYDRLRHFAQAQLAAARGEGAPHARDYIQPQALGEAILATLDPQQVISVLGTASHAAPRRSLVLIDEIDKAPRDFPNDLLNQIDEREFHIPDMGKEAHFRAAEAFTPLVVITSNSERQLPEAFLRRCVYHHIEFPADGQELQQALAERLALLELPSKARTEAIALFFAWRKDRTFSRAPSTSELLDWLLALQAHGLDEGEPLAAQRVALRASVGSLYKTSEDLAHASKLLDKP